MCTIIAALYWGDCFISVISAVVGSAVGFDGKLWLGGVAGFGDDDIDESREVKWEESYRCVRRRSCSIWGFWGRGVSTTLLIRKV